MATVREEIAKNLLFYRKRSGFTQKELAEKLGVKNTAVSNWESGNNSIDIETLFKACNVLGVNLSDMYGQYAGKTESGKILSSEEDELIENYRALNEEGRGKLRDYATDLNRSGRYEKASSRSAAG